MTRRQLSHLDFLKLWTWVDKQTLTHTDSNASLAQKANSELGFDVDKGQGVTESNVRGVLRKKNLQIPIPPPKPKPAPPPETEATAEPTPPTPEAKIATLQVQMHTVADVISSWMKDQGRDVPASLAHIARPQKALFKEQTP